jgi:hypothetical protein
MSQVAEAAGLGFPCPAANRVSVKIKLVMRANLFCMVSPWKQQLAVSNWPFASDAPVFYPARSLLRKAKR